MIWFTIVYLKMNIVVEVQYFDITELFLLVKFDL